MNGKETKDRPVILGGGLSGIAAALHLTDAGYPPLLIESRPFLGGRFRSFVHRQTGDEIDNGRHMMMGCYHSTLNLLSRLGTRSLVDLQRSLHVDFRSASGEKTSLSAPSFLPSPLNVLVGMLSLQGLSVAERWGLMRVGLEAKRKDPSPEETVAAYLTRLSQTPKVCERLWYPLVVATLNTNPEEASAFLFARILRLAFLGKGQDSTLVFPRVGLSRLIAPTTTIIERDGGEVLTGSPVQEIIHEEDRWAIRTRNRTFSTRHLISALPWGSFESLVRPHTPKLHSFGLTVDHNPIISIYFWYDRELESFPTFSAMLGTDVEWVFNRRRISAVRNDNYPGLLECVISAANRFDGVEEEELVHHIEGELHRAFPELQGARMLCRQIIREKQATFAARPDVEKLRPEPGRIGPGIYCAGDWTSTGLPATIEGGVQSGITAATFVVADMEMV